VEENNEECLKAVWYLDIDVLKEHRKLLLQKVMEPVSETARDLPTSAVPAETLLIYSKR
jgi:hypothetical protein